VSVVNAVAVSMVFGVPTIKRERESYLSRTLLSLIDSLNDEESPDCLIVVMVCEVCDASDYFFFANSFTVQLLSSVSFADADHLSVTHSSKRTRAIDLCEPEKMPL